jgi:hypothetical protein
MADKSELRIFLKKIWDALIFLLSISMNEVNIKYWFRDFQKFFFIDFLDELGLFIGEKPIFTKKKFPSWFHGCPNENFVRPIFERCFQVRDFSFWITDGFGLTGVSFHFWPQKQIPSGSSHTNFRLLMWNIDQFYCWGLIWCKILCWTQNNILYGV